MLSAARYMVIIMVGMRLWKWMEDSQYNYYSVPGWAWQHAVSKFSALVLLNCH